MAQTEAAENGAANGRATELARFRPLDRVELAVSVELGRTPRKLRDLLGLRVGSVVVLDKSAGESVDIRVNDVLFARGEVVAGDESFGVRITGVVEHEG